MDLRSAHRYADRARHSWQERNICFNVRCPSRRLEDDNLSILDQQFLERLRAAPIHLCRLRYFAEDRLSMALFTYSNERYEPSIFADGSFHGTPEKAFELAATYVG